MATQYARSPGANLLRRLGGRRTARSGRKLDIRAERRAPYFC